MMQQQLIDQTLIPTNPVVSFADNQLGISDYLHDGQRVISFDTAFQAAPEYVSALANLIEGLTAYELKGGPRIRRLSPIFNSGKQTREYIVDEGLRALTCFPPEYQGRGLVTDLMNLTKTCADGDQTLLLFLRSHIGINLASEHPITVLDEPT